MLKSAVVEVEVDVRDYGTYFSQLNAQSKEPKTMLDPAPRVILDSEWGLVVAGRTAHDAAIAGDIYRHTIAIILRANALEGWRALPPADVFAVEYWDLEQAKLRRSGPPPVFTGEVALVTGAASGIGRACVAALLQRGAAVVGLDINPAIVTAHARPDFRGIVCDLTSETSIAAALEEGTRAFGGLDILVLNAGIFPSSRKIEELDTATWRIVVTTGRS